MFKLNTCFWFAIALIVWNACASQAKSLDDIRAEGPLGWMGISNSRDQKSVKKIAIEEFKEKLGRLQAQQKDIQKILAIQQDSLNYLKKEQNSLMENGMKKIEDLTVSLLERMEKQQKDSQTKMEAQEQEWDKLKIQQEVAKEMSEDIQEKQKKMEDRMETFMNKMEGLHTSLVDRMEKHEKDRQTKTEAQVQLISQPKIEFPDDYEISKEVPEDSEELSTPNRFEKIGSRLFYIERTNKLNWFEAESFCQERGGHLAAFENLAEYNAVRAKIPGFDLYWIGINDQAEEGVFVSSASGEPAPYLNWLRNQPDSAGDEDCVQMFGSTSFNGLNDNICSKKMLFICQADEKIQY
ncbi:C-type lectin domain family 4 member F-like [Drosophila rhopaloa]|uniref:C-type lectin domain-containing protein n=1 Tax=Drosophila rhopaloa TaxID=1041015 RepID=A0ABM5GXW7_DRORH|nr:C-type lectin domain family 4 member F-like [Drosophila rhopaloa]